MQPAPQQPPRSVVPYVVMGCGILLVLVACLASITAGMISLARSNPAGAPGMTATIIDVQSRLGLQRGDTCSIALERPTTEQPMCRAQITCGSNVVYGAGTAGYFPCTVVDSPPSVTGADNATTANDGDPAMTLDSAAGVLVISDDPTGTNGELRINATVSGS